jgi:hypothetical protein
MQPTRFAFFQFDCITKKCPTPNGTIFCAKSARKTPNYGGVGTKKRRKSCRDIYEGARRPVPTTHFHRHGAVGAKKRRSADIFVRIKSISPQKQYKGVAPIHIGNIVNPLHAPDVAFRG